MDLLESYLFLFFDSFAAAVILPFRNESAISAMSIFKNYNSYLIFIIALLGSVLGSTLNWWLGTKLAFFKNAEFFNKNKERIKNIEEKWNKYVIWLLLISSIKAVGNPLCLLCGFFKTDLKKFLSLVIFGKFVYYFYLVWM